MKGVERKLRMGRAEKEMMNGKGEWGYSALAAGDICSGVGNYV